ncbi:hypothetical protein [Pseudoponticoccus marisrubri]|nr:hypothetical protein [Pseudoponticoccus marisrubri]
MVWALCLGLGLLAGCGMPEDKLANGEARAFTATQNTEEAKVMALTQALMDLGPGVDPAEARRAARIAVMEPLVWAREWNVTDPPLLHNMKVNNGQRPRGLCKDWADDLERAMRAERFRTFDLHRAIANSRNIRLEHSTLILTAKGAPMETGIVLDPWRQGLGRLYFVGVTEDPRYVWEPRQQVFAWKRDWKARARAETAAQ